MMAAARRQTGIPLSELLSEIDPGVDTRVCGITADSRCVAPGSVFFARRGLTVDATAFIDDAIRAGAVAVVREGPPGVRLLAGGVPEVKVSNLAEVLGRAAHRFYGEPSQHLRVTGVTGTNGKTSVSHFVAHALSHKSAQNPRPAGLIGTLGYGPAGKLEPGLLTTPDVTDVHRILADMRSSGLDNVVMEVSSHALSQGRVEGVIFDTAVFTNLSRDHLDFHESMADYGETKARLFHAPGLAHAVINADDKFGVHLLERLPSRIEAIPYSLNERPGKLPVDPSSIIHGRLLRIDTGGSEIEIRRSENSGALKIPLLGRFNAQNILAALGALIAGGVRFERALALLDNVSPVPGRMQTVRRSANDPLVVIDYSHTPDALASALTSLRHHCDGRIWCVFGCGGDRDKGKRSQMGAVAEALADVIVLTDDNPRTEDGDEIIDAITKSIVRLNVEDGTLHIERDRAAAISIAVKNAAANDIVLVAGKGHETYQEVGGVRRPFSDSAATRNALEDRKS